MYEPLLVVHVCLTVESLWGSLSEEAPEQLFNPGRPVGQSCVCACPFAAAACLCVSFMRVFVYACSERSVHVYGGG